MEFTYEIIEHIRELHSTSRVEAQRLRSEAEEAIQTERVWAELDQLLAKGWMVHILKLLEKEVEH